MVLLLFSLDPYANKLQKQVVKKKMLYCALRGPPRDGFKKRVVKLDEIKSDDPFYY